ncbi:MAG: VWA domain-containing protein [Gemmataceae bacterium]
MTGLHLVNLGQPLALLFLLVVPFALWRHLRRRQPAVRISSLALFDEIASPGAWFARHGAFALRLAGLIALILALAQPRWPDLRTRLDTEGVAILFAVDVSGSMAERDFLWDRMAVSRLEAVQRVFRAFVVGANGSEVLADGSHIRFEGRPTDQLGLVCFASRPETVCPLTLNHSTLLQMLEAEMPRGVPGESETNLSDALAVGLARLRTAPQQRRVLILLTDGEHNQAETRSTWSPLQAAQVAASLKIPIYTIDAGPPAEATDTPDQLRARELAVQTLQEMARLTGGDYFAARDSVGLLQACRTIDKLERSPIASFQYRRYHEAYPWLALTAFLLAAGAFILEQTVWSRLP